MFILFALFINMIFITFFLIHQSFFIDIQFFDLTMPISFNFKNLSRIFYVSILKLEINILKFLILFNYMLLLTDFFIVYFNFIKPIKVCLFSFLITYKPTLNFIILKSVRIFKSLIY
jgi:hypothetical protein